MYCDRYCAAKAFEGVVYVKPLYCRTWPCEECGPTRKRQLFAQALTGQPNTFLTLTSATTRPGTQEHHAFELAQAWPKLVRRMIAEAARDPRRRPVPRGPALDPTRAHAIDGRYPNQVRLLNGKLPFLAVFEKTQSGEPHLHIVCRAKWISQEWLSAQMRELMGSPIVHVERIHDVRKMVAYVSKYLAKDPHKFDRCKRYWQSRDYQLPRPGRRAPGDDLPGCWQFVPMTAAAYVAESVGLGMVPRDVKPDRYELRWRPG